MKYAYITIDSLCVFMLKPTHGVHGVFELFIKCGISRDKGFHELVANAKSGDIGIAYHAQLNMYNVINIYF